MNCGETFTTANTLKHTVFMKCIEVLAQVDESFTIVREPQDILKRGGTVRQTITCLDLM